MPNEISLNKAELEDVLPETISPKPDKRAKEEREKGFPSKSVLARHRYRQETRRMLREEELRLKSAKQIFMLVVFWMLSVLVIVIFNGLEWLSIPERVLISLLATTTINIAGLLFIVIRYLFPDSARRRQHQPK